MIDSYGKTLYQKVIVGPLLPIVSKFSPCTLTLCALFFGILVMPFLAFHYSSLALIFLCISGVLDTLDGSVARFKNQATPFGAALDIVSDRIVEFSVILGLYFFDMEARSLSCLIMLGSILVCVSSFLVAGIFIQNNAEKSFHYSPGLIERAEAFIFFAIMILFPSIFVVTSSLFSVLVFLTAVIRLWQLEKVYR